MRRRRIERAFERFRRTGEPRALADVFDATAPELLRVAGHWAPDAAAAEDLLQKTFVSAIESAATWERSRRLLPWLVGILNAACFTKAWTATHWDSEVALAPGFYVNEVEVPDGYLGSEEFDVRGPDEPDVVVRMKR